ncbi:sporulation protein [Streptomyces sp. Act143]|uniref:spore germination protein GerW family protein n=1 Tax=Streptomyces sp. Act143 TaxID=2200760 RepID=UPI000D682152|nr:spore germination protein GerW family protein [Streptomyces sp. Act143]PWI14698.1 sporulation protein [Streptomyces sp. Act143]
MTAARETPAPSPDPGAAQETPAPAPPAGPGAAQETSVPAPSPEPGAAQASVTLLERLAEKLGGKASVGAVYGEPITRDGITVVPVARVGFGFGGGAGRETGTARTGEGGGGGGGVDARPLGYIEIKNGTAVYRPIRDPWVDIALPLAGMLVGIAGSRSARALTRRRNHRH